MVGNFISSGSPSKGGLVTANGARSANIRYSTTGSSRRVEVSQARSRKPVDLARTNLLGTIAVSRTGRYPLFTQDGTKYVTIGYKDSESTSAKPKPGLELKATGQRSEILIHPGQGFLASIGCINPCTSLPNAAEMIDFVPSRKRVIAIIDDLKAFTDRTFPATNGKRIPNAFVVIDGEPQFQS